MYFPRTHGDQRCFLTRISPRLSLQARLADGLWQLSAAVLLACTLAAAPAAATYYQTNPRCWDGSTPDCSSTGPIRTNCYSGAQSLQDLLGSWSKIFNCDDADWTSLSSKCGSGSTGFSSYGFIKVDSDDTYSFSLGGSGGSAMVQLDDDSSFMQSAPPAPPAANPAPACCLRCCSTCSSSLSAAEVQHRCAHVHVRWFGLTGLGSQQLCIVSFL